MIDDFNREALGIEVDFSLPSERVIRALDQIIAWRGKPSIIRADNGPELVSGRLMEWAAKHQIHIQHIQPGKPQQNAYVERFNRTVRYEWLSQHYWQSVDEVQDFATRWMYKYNNQRQTWHWAALPRNSDWPWLLNESYFWIRLNKGGLPAY